MAKYIDAKYPGICAACHGSFPAGETVLWARGSGSRHVQCQSRVAAQQEPAGAAALITVTRVTNDRPCNASGRVFRHPEHGALVVVRQDIRAAGDVWRQDLYCRPATAAQAKSAV